MLDASGGGKRRKKSSRARDFRMASSGPRPTQLGLASHGLLVFVDELLLNIIDCIDTHQALCNLAVTCARFQDLVEPYVWRKILVLTGTQANRIVEAIDSRPERVDYIHNLSIRYRDVSAEGIEELNHPISLMSRLKHLTLETPCPNNSEWKSRVIFDGWSRIDFESLIASSVQSRHDLPLTLPMLKSLSLHGHGSGPKKFCLGRAVAMFQHPTLQEITISCLNFDAEMRLEHIPEERRGSTPLRALTLIECNVNVLFLDAVLSLPKALQELSIGERLHVFPPDCKPCMDAETRTSSPLFLSALQRQAHSLRRLTHIGGLLEYQTIRKEDPDGSAKMRSLTKLQYLELGLESNLYFYLRNHGFPPSLQTLKMIDSAISLNSGSEFRVLTNTVFHSLRTFATQHLPIDLPCGFVLYLRMSESPFFRFFLNENDEQNRLFAAILLDRPAMYEIAKALRRRNACFRIDRERFERDACIPPFMYGETLPFEERIYDSDDLWTVCGRDYQGADDPEFTDDYGGD